MLTQKRLKELLSYDPRTGEFRRRPGRTGRTKTDRNPGALNTNGHRQIRLDEVLYLAHRLVWLYVFGTWPVNQIDHINGNKDDNRLANLRDVTNKQNCENKIELNRNNPSGYRCVWWSEQHGKWRAGIGHNDKRVEVGLFDDPAEASEAVERKRDEIFTHHRRIVS